MSSNPTAPNDAIIWAIFGRNYHGGKMNESIVIERQFNDYKKWAKHILLKKSLLLQTYIMRENNLFKTKNVGLQTFYILLTTGNY